MERLVILPFSIGCVSHASVVVAVQRQHHQHRRSKPADTNSTTKCTQEEDEENLSGENIKYLLKSMPLPKPTEFNRLLSKRVKTLSQLIGRKRFLVGFIEILFFPFLLSTGETRLVHAAAVVV
ncbi:hypothetical protein V6N12_024539 [Hibiscus sabdariffa]|uniref:Uncharacterized protein n=1 Tax=Hibiscus sabdariffa TaxID=183260 RepID=A0ABR2G0U1_9ROSI